MCLLGLSRSDQIASDQIARADLRFEAAAQRAHCTRGSAAGGEGIARWAKALGTRQQWVLLVLVVVCCTNLVRI